jgi:hypothetical protein
MRRARTVYLPPVLAEPIEALVYPKRVRRFFGTFGVHPGAPCLWASKAEAIENCEADERVYEFRVEMIRQVTR